MSVLPEAFSRVLIDQALKDSDWDLLDTQQVRFEMSGRDGRADYVLLDQHGHALCVLEAKREDADPYEAKEQARGYAENLRAPFILLSNGREHWFWNYLRADQQDAYRVERLPSRRDLERQRFKNLQPPRPLVTEHVGPDYLKPFKPEIKLHGYQIQAIEEVSKQFDRESKRKFLLEMATGTGKTLLCAALIRRFLSTRNAERVLFIVDRIELAKQTMEDFNVVLREYSPVIFKTARRHPSELLGSCVVVATIQSLMVDRRYREEFTPFHFDLVINDEAHRSIYGDAREVVQFFQATRIGLTATPKAYLKNIDIDKLGRENPKALEGRQLRDTYRYFGCEPGFPTFRYDIVDAVKDPEGPFLCIPRLREEQVSGARCQVPGVRSQNEGHLLFAGCLLLSALRFLPSAYCRPPPAFRIRDSGVRRAGVGCQVTGARGLGAGAGARAMLNSELSIADCEPPSHFWPPPTAFCLLPTAVAGGRWGRAPGIAPASTLLLL